VPCACNVSSQLRTARHTSSTEVVTAIGRSPTPGAISTTRALRRAGAPASSQALSTSDLMPPLPWAVPGATGLTGKPTTRLSRRSRTQTASWTGPLTGPGGYYRRSAYRQRDGGASPPHCHCVTWPTVRPTCSCASPQSTSGLADRGARFLPRGASPRLEGPWPAVSSRASAHGLFEPVLHGSRRGLVAVPSRTRCQSRWLATVTPW
jgi:hypothetical protein